MTITQVGNVHLAIVLVDEDGEGERRRDLLSGTDGLPGHRVIAVAVREFEAWLIADQQALVSVLDVTETPRSPESMKPREAKGLLQGWLDGKVAQPTSQAERADRTRQLRSQLAQLVSLDVLEQLAAWKQFRSDLRDALASIP